MVQMGNKVQFGPQTGDNFIEHLKSKTKIPMQRNGKGSFLLNVDFVNGGSTSITVDGRQCVPEIVGRSIQNDGGEIDKLSRRFGE